MTHDRQTVINPVLKAPDAWKATQHLQAIARAISDMLNDPESVGEDVAAEIVSWAWRVAAVADCCEMGREHMVWPYAEYDTKGGMRYRCVEHRKMWKCWWAPSLLNPLPWDNYNDPWEIDAEGEG